MAEQIGLAYGGSPQEKFGVEYHTTAAAELLSSGPELVPAGELPVLRHEAGLHILDALGAALDGSSTSSLSLAFLHARCAS